MKVTTDACLLGATAPLSPEGHILDIGAGTGVLSLMAAQRTQAEMTGIELDRTTYAECLQNIQASPWANRIHLIQTDFKNWVASNTQIWDSIICNPPFFANHLLNQDEKSSLARHTENLDAAAVIDFAGRYLSATGILSLLMPKQDEAALLELCAQHGLQHCHVTTIKETATHLPKRLLLFASKNPINETLPPSTFIMRAHEDYTPLFTSYLSPFYLHL